MTEDLFAPRPKLSWRLKAIRSGALLAAIGISLCFFALDMFALGPLGEVSWLEFLQKKAPVLFLPTVVQILILVPCWRCWLLRRWACIATAFLFILVPPFLLSAMLIAPIIPLFCFVIAFVLLSIIASERSHLKSGF